MPRILFGVTVPETANAFLKPQLTTLMAEGWEVHLACSPELNFDALKSISGLTVHSIPMKRGPSPLKDLMSLYRWHRLVRDVKPGVVVGGTPKAGLLSMLASKWNKTPTRIYHARGFRAEGLLGLNRSISLVAERLSTRSATEVLCDSFSLRAALRNLGCLRQDRGIVLGAGSCCGVDTKFFRQPNIDERSKSRQLLGYGESDIVIGFVGRITKDKGICELVQAISQVNNAHSNVRLALFGPDEGGIDDLGDLMHNNSITYMGPVEDVRSVYWAFDIFALPSYREGFPIAPLEAQSCGLPLITTSATGCIDSQPPRNSVLTVEPKSTSSLVSPIEFLVLDLGARATMGEHARQWVQANFNATDVVRRHISFLEMQVA